jgi:hypothetical protein
MLNIIFQFGDFLSEGGESNSWWLDLLNSVIGAAIGSGATIWALYRTFKQDKKKEEVKRIQFQKEKLKYFQSLLRTITSGLKLQIEHFKSYAIKIKNNPVDLPLLTYVPLNELDRIVNKLNQEDYYHSFLGEFGDNQIVVDEFRDIISTLNYFDGNLLIIKDSLKKSFDFDYERKISLKNIIDKSMDDAAALLINNDIIQSHNALWNFINTQMIEFHEKTTDKADLKFYYENFVEPLKNGLIEYAVTIPLAHYLIIQLKNATMLYHSIQSHNTNVADDFENWNTTMNIEYDKYLGRIKRIAEYNVA